MKELTDLLGQKERELERVQTEIEALRLVLGLLGGHEQDRFEVERLRVVATGTDGPPKQFP